MSEVLVQGREKTIYLWGKLDVTVVCHNVVLSNGNGASVELRDSGILIGSITAKCLRLLELQGILTHFQRWFGGDAFFAYRLEMFPIRVVVYRIATEAMALRHRLSVSTRLDDLFVEYFFKDTEVGDLLLDTIDFRERGLLAYRPDYPLASRDGMISCVPFHQLFGPNRDVPTFLEIIMREAKNAFLALESAWKKEGAALDSLALQFGADLEHGSIRIGDCIGPTSWSLRPLGHSGSLNPFSVHKTDDPAKVMACYRRIAEATDRFTAHL